MILSLQATFRFWLRAVVYKSLPASIVTRFKRTALEAPIHETVPYWNAQFTDRLSNPNLNARIGNALRDTTTAIMIRQCGPTPISVLDVGCGFGDLADALADQGMKNYVGVDLSDYVIERAKSDSSKRTAAGKCDLSFHHADLRQFMPESAGSTTRTFDVIVFNEVLKYIEVDEAVAQLKRYAEWLAPDGVLCVNITDDPKCRAIFRELDRAFTWVYGTVYQQRPDGPKYRLTHNDATPAYLVGLFRP